MLKKLLILIFLLVILIVMAGCDNDLAGEAKKVIELEHSSHEPAFLGIDQDEFAKATNITPTNVSNDTIIVKFKPGKTRGLPTTTKYVDAKSLSVPSTVEALNEKHGVDKAKRIAPSSPNFPSLEGVVVLKMEGNVQEAMMEYLADPNVEFAVLNAKVQLTYEPNDPLFPLMWNLHNTGQDYPNLYGPLGTPDSDVDYPEALDSGFGENEVIVAVLDTGVDYNHEDIAENMWINPGEDLNGNGIVEPEEWNEIDDDDNGYVDDLYGFDFSGDIPDFHPPYVFYPDSDPIDSGLYYSGHGTHCAGTIAAKTDNQKGISGVCPNCKIMALKVFPNSYFDVIVEAMVYAIDNDAKVLSNSWVCEGGWARIHGLFLESVVEEVYDANSLFVISAGNDDIDMDETYYPPQTMPERNKILVVAATNSNDNRADFSNYGSFVDVSAPGVDIMSLRANGTDMYRDEVHIFNESGLQDINGKYYVASGTSMSAPHVAGLAAFLWSHNPNWTNTMVNEQIKTHTDDIYPNNPNYVGLLGTGRINMFNSLNSPLPQHEINGYVAGIFDREKVSPLRSEVTTKNVGVMVENNGLNAEEDIYAEIYHNGELLASQTIPYLESGERIKVGADVDLTAVFYNNFTFNITLVEGEENVTNNAGEKKAWVYTRNEGYESISENDFIFDCNTYQNPLEEPIRGWVGPFIKPGFIEHSWGMRTPHTSKQENVMIRNCNVGGWLFVGIAMENCTNCSVINNNVSGNRLSSGVFYARTEGGEIKSNNVRDNLAHGIGLYASVKNILVKNNKIFNNDKDGIRNEWNTRNNTFIGTVINNKIWNNKHGIYLGQFGSPMNFVNNEVCDNRFEDFYCYCLNQHDNDNNIGTGNMFGSVVECRDGWPQYGINYLSCDNPCEEGIFTACGDVFPPDCDYLGDEVCCGDDEFEIFVFKQCHEDLYPAVNCETDGTLHVCCDNSDYVARPSDGMIPKGCTDGNTCFAPTELFDVDEDGHTEDCWWDSWYDPDDNPDHCYIFGGCEEADLWAGPEDNCPENTKRFFVQEGESGDSAVFGEYGNGNMYECEGKSSDSRCLPYNCDSRTQDCYECCGDDEGEYLTYSNGYTRCCNSPFDLVDLNGECKDGLEFRTTGLNPNLLLNPRFEVIGADVWILENYGCINCILFFDDERCYNGRCVHLRSYYPEMLGAKQILAVEPSTTYRLVAHMKANLYDDWVYAYIRPKDCGSDSSCETGEWITEPAEGRTNSSNWTRVAWEYTTSPDTHYIKFFAGPKHDSSVFVDNLEFSLTEDLNEYTICDVEDVEIGDDIRVYMTSIFNPEEPNNPIPVDYIWETELQIGRGLCNRNMLVISPDNIVNGNPPLEFYSQDHFDPYFKLEKIEEIVVPPSKKTPSAAIARP